MEGIILKVIIRQGIIPKGNVKGKVIAYPNTTQLQMGKVCGSCGSSISTELEAKENMEEDISMTNNIQDICHGFGQPKT